MDSELQAGDFVYYNHAGADGMTFNIPDLKRLILCTTAKSKGWAEADALVIPLNTKGLDILHGERHLYVKIPPTKELIAEAREKLECGLRKRQIDNLTYIEILDKLNEYDRRIP